MATQAILERPLDMFSGPFRNQMNERRDARVPYCAQVSLLWDEQSSEPRYARAVCTEISERGLTLEAAEPVPVATRVAL